MMDFDPSTRVRIARDGPMTFETIRKASAPEMVVEQILKKIHDGVLPTGGQLPSQRELANLLGVGRSSVREAINALAVMGYLDVLQGKGTFIRRDLPTADPTTAKLKAALEAGSMVDLMEAREVLEGTSAGLAADRADADTIQRLHRRLERVIQSKADYTAFLDADLAFHGAVAEATGNPVICEMTKLVLKKVVADHARLRTAMLPSSYREISIATARQILAGIEAGDGAAAAEAMRSHLNAFRGELQHIIAE